MLFLGFSFGSLVPALVSRVERCVIFSWLLNWYTNSFYRVRTVYGAVSANASGSLSVGAFVLMRAFILSHGGDFPRM